MPHTAPASAAGSEGTRWSGRGPAAPELDQQVIIDRHEQVERAGQLPDPSQQTRQRLRVGKGVDQRDRADSPALIAAQPGIDPGARWGGLDDDRDDPSELGNAELDGALVRRQCDGHATFAGLTDRGAQVRREQRVRHQRIPRLGLGQTATIAVGVG